VNAAVPKDTDAGTAFAARRKVIAEIEKESLDRTGLRSDVVTLWQGGAYHLYRYKRYTDVRLVLRRSNKSPFTAATRTISSTRVTIWTSACFAPTRTASRQR